MNMNSKETQCEGFVLIYTSTFGNIHEKRLDILLLKHFILTCVYVDKNAYFIGRFYSIQDSFKQDFYFGSFDILYFV